VHAQDDANWGLYDLLEDPGEQRDVAALEPDEAARMRAGYDAWFQDVSSTRGFAPVPIQVGTEDENPVLLTRQDRREPPPGYWAVHVARAGTYTVTAMFDAVAVPGTASLKLGDVQLDMPTAAGTTEHTFKNVMLKPGDGELRASSNHNGKVAGATYVSVERVD
jgi:hypothetical protein